MAKTRSATRKESDIQREILEYLERKGIFHWRQNSGVAFVHGRKMTLGPEGIPDILVVVKGGHLVGLEVKSETGKLRPDQRLWAMKADRVGVRTHVVRSVQEAAHAVEQGQYGLGVGWFSQQEGYTVEGLERQVQEERGRKRAKAADKKRRGGAPVDRHKEPG